MNFSFLKAVKKKFYKSTLCGGGPNFEWSEFIIPSTLQLSPLIQTLVEPVSSKQTIEKIHLGLHEALVNAVQHGNSGDPSKYLRVRRILTPNWLVWQIQDQGQGISINSRGSALPSQIDADHGRGIFLIHQCFDDVRWSRKGNRLQLAYKRTSVVSDVDS